jgi:hypothetical protein
MSELIKKIQEHPGASFQKKPVGINLQNIDEYNQGYYETKHINKYMD